MTIIDRVTAIDAGAGTWLYGYMNQHFLFRKPYINYGSISSLFTWNSTPQGWDYWKGIERKLRERKDLTPKGNRINLTL